MNYENAWGINSYYSDRIPHQVTDEEREVGGAWQSSLSKVMPDAKRQVETVKDKWNSRVREMLRNETGLKFQRMEYSYAHQSSSNAEGKEYTKQADDSMKRAPIKIVDGFPPPLVRHFAELSDQADILLRQKDFATTKATLDFASANFDRMLKYFKEPSGRVNPIQLGYVAAFFDGIVKEVSRYNPIEQLLNMHKECYGAYYFRIPEIHIYWLPIAIMAQTSSVVDIESLTFIVLAHELAHAYTHQGKDIDGTDWNTEDFAHTDEDIVEGIAQFYTLQLCKRMRVHSSRFEDSFMAMVERQARPYTRFMEWIKEMKSGQKKPHGEIIRAAMLQARRLPILEIDAFEHGIHELKSRLDTRGLNR